PERGLDRGNARILRAENGQGARYHQDGPDDREKSDALGSPRRRALARIRFESAGHGTNGCRRWRDRGALGHAGRPAVQTASGENLGGRFSRKAAAPSGASRPPKPRNSMPSEASKIGPAARSQLLRAYLVERIAFGAPSARRTATSMARACSSSAGTAS